MKAKKPTETESFDAAELGAMMREVRENLGHDLDTVASDLRIRLVYLEAIEAGRLNDLPGNAYVSGFLRSYSDFLGLDGNEIVRRFKMAGAEISSQPQLHLPSPVEEGRLPTGSILLVAAVIAAAAYGGWYYLSAAGKGPIETVASLPKELSGLVDGAKNQSAVKQMAPDASAPASGTSSSDAAIETSGDSADRADGSVRIVVRATADSYVAVRTGQNEPLFSQLMRPGDSYEVPSGADLVLETGNAGGLQITIGGKRAPSLGPVGQIRRNIPLDAEKLLRGLN